MTSAQFIIPAVAAIVTLKLASALASWLLSLWDRRRYYVATRRRGFPVLPKRED